MEEIQEVINKHIRFYKDRNGKDYSITLEFKNYDELLDMLSTVVEKGYCDGQGSTLSSNPDISFKTPVKYSKQFTDTIKHNQCYK